MHMMQLFLHSSLEDSQVAGVLAGGMVELPPAPSTFGCNNQLTYSTVNGTNPENYTYSGNFSIAGSSRLAVRYDMYGNPDRLRLYRSNGIQVFDSGYAGTRSAAPDMDLSWSSISSQYLPPLHAGLIYASQGISAQPPRASSLSVKTTR